MNSFNLTKPLIHLPKKKAGDKRIGDIINFNLDPQNANLIIIGFCSDIGVFLNQGRIGAKYAPDKIREEFFSLSPDPRYIDKFESALSQISDLGNITVTSKDDLANAQQYLADTISPYLKAGKKILILGGGHETTYGHFLAYAKIKKTVNIFNFDAHADVRPLVNNYPHSGSPFYQILTKHKSNISKYTVAGLAPEKISQEQFNFLSLHNCNIIWQEECCLTTLSNIIESAKNLSLVSLDLDVIDQAFSEGVSSLNAKGIPSSFLYKVAFQCGQNNNIQSLDIVECNPIVDKRNTTAKIAGLIIWHFLQGIALR